MDDMQKVIKGLQGVFRCVSPVGYTCGDCPYQDNRVGCKRRVLSDAIALLEAQKPRLMSWEEVAAWNRMEESERDPIFVEYCSGKGFGHPCWTIKGFGYNLNYPTNSAAGYYGKYVRCWTGRPTQMQMEEAKWE